MKKIFFVLILLGAIGFGLYEYTSLEDEVFVEETNNKESVDELYGAEDAYEIWGMGKKLPYYEFNEDGTGEYGLWNRDRDRKAAILGSFEYELSPIHGEDDVFSVNFSVVDGEVVDIEGTETILYHEDGMMELDFQDKVELYIQDEVN